MFNGDLKSKIIKAMKSTIEELESKPGKLLYVCVVPEHYYEKMAEKIIEEIGSVSNEIEEAKT